MREHEQVNDADAEYMARRLSDEAAAPPKERSFPSPRSASGADRSLATRIDAACRATRALTFPPPDRATAPAQRDGGVDRDATTSEELLLASALRVLRDLALPVASIALNAAGPATWRAIPQSDDSRDLDLDLGDVASHHLGKALIVSRSRRADLWRALTPWHDSAPHLDHAVLVPVLVGEELRALFALGFAGGHDEGWLPTADAVATACAAGIELRRLSGRIETETQARDAYISLAAHELRSPITSIKGYAQLLVRQARKLAEPLPAPMLRSVESIEQQSARMAEMIGELLDASRIRRGVLELLPQPADLVEIVRGAVARRGPHHPQQTFTFASDAPSLTGTWDAARIEQVARDLLENAARHSPDGGLIATTVEREGNLAIVTVRDEGSGVAEEDRERIFDYLYRSPISVQRNLAGLGLGLYVSRHIVERHGGQFQLAATRADDPKGSTFRFTLPIAIESSSAPTGA
jgi:signal transduction histidine kinase